MWRFSCEFLALGHRPQIKKRTAFGSPRILFTANSGGPPVSRTRHQRIMSPADQAIFFNKISHLHRLPRCEQQSNPREAKLGSSMSCHIVDTGSFAFPPLSHLVIHKSATELAYPL